MKIPTSFCLHGITYTVCIDPELKAREDSIGETRYRDDCVLLQPSVSKFQSQTRMEQTFCHELVHAILYEMHSDLRTNEVFVDNFACLLHQYMVSTQEVTDARPISPLPF